MGMSVAVSAENEEQTAHENPENILEYISRRWLPDSPDSWRHWLHFCIPECSSFQISSVRLALVSSPLEFLKYRFDSPRLSQPIAREAASVPPDCAPDKTGDG